ncbi:Uncharacterized protein APZ42_029013 [Daphnia magna]|uniref:Uncharacterized protein n=1 Tax=Daphnia magna TaxID=35525 RepID=A0A164Q0P9_9CRUS|nr:Uncharacterized protein APZ42_029013 [Daphnia magna]
MRPPPVTSACKCFALANKVYTRRNYLLEWSVRRMNVMNHLFFIGFARSSLAVENQTTCYSNQV